MNDKTGGAKEPPTEYTNGIVTGTLMTQQACMAINDKQNTAASPLQLPGAHRRCVMQRKAPPVKERPGIGLAPWRDIGVPNDCINWIKCAQRLDQIDESKVLCILEGLLITALQFNANREIIAALTALPGRYSGVPGALLATNELDQCPVAGNQKVGRNTGAADPCEIGMGIRVEGVGKQADNIVAAKLCGWQTDGMHHEQRDDCSDRAIVMVWRVDALRCT